MSARNLTSPCPRFLWQALKDKDHPDYATWLLSYNKERDGLISLDTYEVILEMSTNG
ncbi:MAG: hypothetical protein ACRCYW_20130 [Aeromonas sp.]|uniref:hypothetical protein n=1 Tax=Aeromonas sp. TaxID=647 RepID=UPI003F3CDABF